MVFSSKVQMPLKHATASPFQEIVMLKKVLAVIAAFCVPAGALAATALVNVPGSPVYFTPDQIGAGLNYVINAINAQTISSLGNIAAYSVLCNSTSGSSPPVLSLIHI